MIKTKISVFGLGHIGLPFTAALASVGFRVIGVDSDVKRIEMLQRGEFPFYEPGMKETLERNRDLIEYTSDSQRGVKEANAIFITVGTPLKSDGTPDYTSIDSCAQDIGRNLSVGQLVVLKSTVVLGTTENYFRKKLESISGLVAGRDFYLAFCPERTVEGLALHELYTLPKIIGGINEESSLKTKKILERLTGKVTIVSSPKVAEMCKLADNIYRATNIALANEFGMLCEKAGIDSEEFISAVVRAYPRTNIFKPALGADGPCLSKDPAIFKSSANLYGMTRTPIIDASIEQNHYSTLRIIDILNKFYRENNLTEIDLCIMGLSFKGFPETDDLRGSPAIKLLEKMEKEGIPLRSVKLYDPLVQNFPGHPVLKDINLALENSNVVMFLTNHPKIMRLPFEKIISQTRRPLLIIDGWGNLEDLRENEEGVVYFKIGKGYI